ncbi:MAG TPA: hypothetical protein VEX35_12715 [Allosphingosinicella sp.]|nr:hypothetical protein [Allosphingosinicella sp.]
MSETPPKIARAARRLRLLTLFAIAVIELLILFAAWVVAEGRAADFPMLNIHTGGLARGPAALSLLLFGLLFGAALLKLVAMLRRIEGGAPFAAAGLRGFARYLFFAVLVSELAPPLIGAAMGSGRMVLMLGSGSALMLLVTGLLFFVARLLDEAQRLADDHSQIV